MALNKQLRHAKTVQIPLYQVVKNVLSHRSLWPAHPSLPVASPLFSLSNVDPSSQLQRPPPVFPTFIPSWTSCILPAKKSFLQSFLPGLPNLDHYLFHAQPCERYTVNNELLSSLNLLGEMTNCFYLLVFLFKSNGIFPVQKRLSNGTKTPVTNF